MGKTVTVWDYMKRKGLTADDIIAEVSSRNDAIEYGWELARKYCRGQNRKRNKRRKNISQN